MKVILWSYSAFATRIDSRHRSGIYAWPPDYQNTVGPQANAVAPTCMTGIYPSEVMPPQEGNDAQEHRRRSKLQAKIVVFTRRTWTQIWSVCQCSTTTSPRRRMTSKDVVDIFLGNSSKAFAQSKINRPLIRAIPIHQGQPALHKPAVVSISLVVVIATSTF